MKLNKLNFVKILTKVSCGNVFDYVQLNVTKDKVVSNMTLPSMAMVSMIELDNDFLIDMKDESYEMNFSNFKQDVFPHLELLEDEEIDAKIQVGPHGNVSNITLESNKNSVKLNLAMAIPSLILKNVSIAKGIEYFAVVDLSSLPNFRSIKKTAFLTNKIYFEVDNGLLYLVLGDKKQKHVNCFKTELQEVESKNLSICLDARLFLACVDEVWDCDKKFIKLAYRFDKRLGMVNVTSGPNESYVIPQLVEV